MANCLPIAIILDLVENGWIGFEVPYDRVILYKRLSHPSKTFEQILHQMSMDEPQPLSAWINKFSQHDITQLIENDLIEKNLLETSFSTPQQHESDFSFRFSSDLYPAESEGEEGSWYRAPLQKNAHTHLSMMQPDFRSVEKPRVMHALTSRGEQARIELVRDLLMMIRGVDIYSLIPEPSTEVTPILQPPLTATDKRPISQQPTKRSGDKSAKGERASKGSGASNAASGSGSSSSEGNVGSLALSSVSNAGNICTAPEKILLPPPIPQFTQPPLMLLYSTSMYLSQSPQTSLPASSFALPADSSASNLSNLTTSTSDNLQHLRNSSVLLLRLLHSFSLLSFILHCSDPIVHSKRLTQLLTDPSALPSNPPPDSYYDSFLHSSSRPSSASPSPSDNQTSASSSPSLLVPSEGRLGTADAPLTIAVPLQPSTPATPSMSPQPKKATKKPGTPNSTAVTPSASKTANKKEDKDEDLKDEENEDGEYYLHYAWLLFEAVLRPFSTLQKACGF
ncbi:uncharacterized protein MONOS_11300 [Monocercomonoides exilis]|uniref:uncharacterized protein n=1 Tax=Monocercomonoides exilis TaxID=2049356 RepID=UPI00355A729C|nr:hypothetical protein MONOS_11300 [Monocercomonoides exilis]|eukprot:MONOS_11300.1-p1 / transcript=MONOS_11300.1 / gene=MONOS_11300 / organism=Monocercomonoides_exilis_PA203 / gene_product=unspecified product / transcript_product=unspecified product / location=Mono_scaffold00560:16448-18091(-) / protein_length=509 / sequence_SO=supercontig / SO=protein_coding / is_pseudo=false